MSTRPNRAPFARFSWFRAQENGYQSRPQSVDEKSKDANDNWNDDNNNNDNDNEVNPANYDWPHEYRMRRWQSKRRHSGKTGHRRINGRRGGLITKGIPLMSVQMYYTIIEGIL